MPSVLIMIATGEASAPFPRSFRILPSATREAANTARPRFRSGWFSPADPMQGRTGSPGNGLGRLAMSRPLRPKP